eukprot:4618384-Lingulodinium_polyedra.AAC.1
MPENAGAHRSTSGTRRGRVGRPAIKIAEWGARHPSAAPTGPETTPVPWPRPPATAGAGQWRAP